MKIAVGCPVRERAWILPQYFDHIDRAFAAIGEQPHYLFSLGTSSDTTEKILVEHGAEFVTTEEIPVDVSKRQWTTDRVGEMAKARNELLGLVRAYQPDFFLSIDSDILLNPLTIPNLIESSEKFDAVGGKLFMSPMGVDFPSYGMIRAYGGLVREDAVGVMQVDAIMALKLMTPAAYNVDYRLDHKGEDIGWSIECRKAGLKLGWDGRACNKHVMLHRQLYETDPRVGY